MIVVVGGICLIVGMIIGRLFQDPDETCPRAIMGYNCKGDWCDHSESKLYEAKMHDAMNRERSGGGPYA